MSTVRVQGVASGPVVALIERQEHGVGAAQPGRHADFTVADGKVDQGPVGEREQRLGGLAFGFGIPVEAVLVDRVADALREVGLQFDRRHGQTVQEQHEVDAVFVLLRVMHLPHHAQPVGGIPIQDVGVHRQSRFELGERQFASQSQQFDAVPQHVQRAALVELIAQATEQRVGGVGAVVLDDGVPRFGLRLLRPRQHIVREQRPRPVVAVIVRRVQPAVRDEVFTDFVFKLDFVVQAHWTFPFATRAIK